jgi:hypothetical protein
MKAITFQKKTTKEDKQSFIENQEEEGSLVIDRIDVFIRISTTDDGSMRGSREFIHAEH